MNSTIIELFSICSNLSLQSDETVISAVACMQNANWEMITVSDLLGVLVCSKAVDTLQSETCR